MLLWKCFLNGGIGLLRKLILREDLNFFILYLCNPLVQLQPETTKKHNRKGEETGYGDFNSFLIYLCHGTHGGGSFLLLCGFQGLNSGHQTWWSLLAERISKLWFVSWDRVSLWDLELTDSPCALRPQCLPSLLWGYKCAVYVWFFTMGAVDQTQVPVSATASPWPVSLSLAPTTQDYYKD